MKLDPKMSDAWYDLGVCYRANHDNERAIQAFGNYLEQVKDTDPEGARQAESDIKALGGGKASKAEKKKGKKRRRKK